VLYLPPHLSLIATTFSRKESEEPSLGGAFGDSPVSEDDDDGGIERTPSGRSKSGVFSPGRKFNLSTKAKARELKERQKARLQKEVRSIFTEVGLEDGEAMDWPHFLKV
jgi:hypothetical protein